MDKFLTLKEVGAHLGVKEATVRRWVRSRKLRAIHPDRGWVYRVRESELERFKAEEVWQVETITPYLRHQIPGLFKKA